MATRIEASTDLRALRLSRERPAHTYNGYIMLLVLVALIAVGAAGLTMVDENPRQALFLLVPAALLSAFVSAGF